MANPKKITPEAPEILPTHGGSYVRQPDGGLKKNEGRVYPAPAETVAQPSSDKPTTDNQE